jgi:hypothetical protein
MAIFSRRKNANAHSPSPRAVPTLYPDYFLSILADAGVTATSDNLRRLVERTACAIGGQAAAYFAQKRDPRSFERFIADFSKIKPPEERLLVADEMIDWLWSWDPFCHDALTAWPKKWRDGSLKPGSYITDNGVAPWNDDTTQAPSDDREVWQTVFEHNWR